MGLGVFREGRLRLEGEHTRKRELSWWRKRGVCKVFCRDLGFRSRARKVFLDEAKPRSTFKGSRRINLKILVHFWAFWSPAIVGGGPMMAAYGGEATGFWALWLFFGNFEEHG